MAGEKIEHLGSTEFLKSEQVLCCSNNLWHAVRIVNVDTSSSKPYRVHFAGFGVKYDEWVDASSIQKASWQNISNLMAAGKLGVTDTGRSSKEKPPPAKIAKLDDAPRDYAAHVPIPRAGAGPSFMPQTATAMGLPPRPMAAAPPSLVGVQSIEKRAASQDQPSDVQQQGDPDAPPLPSLSPCDVIPYFVFSLMLAF